jgi:TonB-linked SusC/RagA family outer membrane protein
MQKYLTRQNLRVMKLLVLFLTVVCLQVHAIGYSQGVTLRKKNASLEKIFEDIYKQTGYQFVYTFDLMHQANKVTIDAKDTPLKEVLESCFKDQPFTYMIIGDAVIVKRKPKVESPPMETTAPIEISGKVTDSLGNPLIGVTIKATQGGTGAVSGASGNYSITVPDDAVLEVSYVGYQTQEIPVNGRTRIDIVLRESISELNQLVVVGYGTQKEANLTGSVTQIDVSSLGDRPVSDIASALEGVIPGLNISSTLGGEMGVEKDINIRGVGSLSGGSPYILVDGVPMSLNEIDPSEIQTVTVLKDAAASAIYGARAAYGVILITTKRGKKNSKPIVSYSGNIGWQGPTMLPRLANSLDFANAINYASQNSGADAVFDDDIIEKIKEYQKDPKHTPGLQPIPGTDTWAGTGGGGKGYSNANTDWYKVYFKNMAFRQHHNLSLRGGGEHSTYYVSMGVLQQDGLMNFANDGYTRYNIVSNLRMDPAPWITASLNVRFISALNKYGGTRAGIPEDVWPTMPVYTPNGDIAYNALKILAKGGEESVRRNKVIITPELNFKLTDDWNLTANFSYFATNGQSMQVDKVVYDSSVTGKPIVNYLSTFSQVTRNMSHEEYMSGNVFSNFTKQFGNYFLNVMAGFQLEKDDYKELSGWKKDLVSSQVTSINAATGDYGVGDRLSQWATEGIFGRINFNYKGKYLLEVDGRYDGSSKFAEGHRWGLFPSASVGYVISKEDFWQPLAGVIDFLKLRASYGALGNQSVPGNLSYVVVPVHSNLGYIFDGVRPTYADAPGLGSYGLTWETAKTTNFGIDVRALESKLSLTADVYDRRTVNMFGPGESLPNVLGTGVPQANNATLATKGIELTIGWQQVINDFNYSVRLVYSDNRSKVLEYNNPTKILNTFYQGMTLGEIWGFQSAGLFQTDEEVAKSPGQTQLFGKWGPGDMRYKDVNGDGEISYGKNTATDPGDQVVIGNSNPRSALGLSGFASYKGFDLSFFFQGILKRDVILDNAVLFGFSPKGIQHGTIRDYQLDFWSPDNQNAFYPKPYVTDENAKNQLPQTRYLTSGAYLRLKNLQLGYNVPSQLLNKVGARRLRIYLSGENLLTFTGLPNGVDPETTYGTTESVYPVSRVLTIGCQVSF